MTLLDVSFPLPVHNLACDEVLLNMLEEEAVGEILRFWTSTQYFVVLGSSNNVRDEVDLDACRADGIPILRRHSGGGTVLQGPGCLNFSLILAIDPNELPAEVLTHRLEQKCIERDGLAFDDFTISLSVGTAYYDPQNPCSLEALMERADRVMYRQKRGRRRGLKRGFQPRVGEVSSLAYQEAAG